jgi:HK97 gp10 family phage protein
MSITISWTTGPRQGFEELEAAFTRCAEALSPEAVSAAIQPAAQLVLETAQRLVPKRSDERLLRSLFAEETMADRLGAEWAIGCERHLGWYAVMVEFGTRPHEERHGKVVHPGAEERPFLRPALDVNRDAIVDLIANALAQDLEAVGVT